MFRQFLTKITIGIMVSIFLAGFATNLLAEMPEKTISIGTASQGGAWYGIASRVMQEIEKARPGLVTQVQPGGAVSNLRRVDAGKTDLGVTIDFVAGLAVNGKGPFKKPTKNVRYLCKFFPGYLQIVTMKKSGIAKFEDLFDKRITAGKNGWAAEMLFRMVLDVYGMNYEKIRAAGGVVNFVGTDQATQMMRDGNLDAMFVTGNPPTHPKFNELSLTSDISLLQFSPEEMDKILKAYPYLFVTEMPANPYRGVPGKFDTIGGDVMVIARGDLSDEAAYTIVKAFYENLAEIKADVRMVRENSLDIATKGVPIPFHPGAAKYYKEKGLQ